MAVSREKARQLCTQKEFELVETSWGKELRELTPDRLQEKIRRTRTLRDKFRDLARQQSGEARGKRAPKSTRPAQGSRNTDLKAQLFDEALERFQNRLDEVEE